MSDEPVLLTVEDGVATVTLNRPDAGNAIDLPTARALGAAAIRCQTDTAIRAVLLTGTGRMFSAGGDVKAMMAAGAKEQGGAPAMLSELIASFHAAVARLARGPKPLVVAVNGPAAGGGFSLAMIGDVVLAAASAHFATAYGMIGLTADGGLSWTLPRLIGLRRAQELLLTNRRVAADEAAAIGLVTRTVADDDLLAEAREVARKLAAGPTRTLGAQRALLWDSADAALEAQLDRELRSMVTASATADHREGLAAFAARRAPTFTGA